MYWCAEHLQTSLISPHVWTLCPVSLDPCLCRLARFPCRSAGAMEYFASRLGVDHACRRQRGGHRAGARALGPDAGPLTDLSKTPAHARAETVAEQPMFRDAFTHRRCLLPANGFYEWRGTVRKRPFWLTPGEGAALFFAAIWEAYPVQGHTYLSVAVVTQSRGNPAPAIDSGRQGPERLAGRRHAAADPASVAGCPADAARAATGQSGQ